MNGLVIKKLSEENFEDFVYLIEKLAEYEKLETPDEKAKIRLRNDGLSSNPKFEAYLGRINNRYICYIIYYMAYSSFLALPTLFLEDIFVLKEYRKKGVGQKMLDFCIKLAKEKKCGRIDLCILDWNTPSIQFFEKNNAKRLNWLFYRMDIGNS